MSQRAKLICQRFCAFHAYFTPPSMWSITFPFVLSRQGPTVNQFWFCSIACKNFRQTFQCRWETESSLSSNAVERLFRKCASIKVFYYDIMQTIVLFTPKYWTRLIKKSKFSNVRYSTSIPNSGSAPFLPVSNCGIPQVAKHWRSQTWIGRLNYAIMFVSYKAKFRADHTKTSFVSLVCGIPCGDARSISIRDFCSSSPPRKTCV